MLHRWHRQGEEAKRTVYARDWPEEFGGGQGMRSACAEPDGWCQPEKSEASLLRLTVPPVQAFWLVRKMRMDAQR